MVREVFGYIGIIRDHVETYLDSRQYEKQNPILEDGAHNTKIFRIDQNTTVATSETGYTVYIDCDGLIPNVKERAATLLNVKALLDKNKPTITGLDGKDIAFVYCFDKRYSFFQYYNRDGLLTHNGPAVEIYSRYALYTSLN
ncbi:hypothetical protein O8H94_000959 [Escherichia coli O157]|nr:hypothetical protein [Escherichia coli O157]EKH6024427.1 hypothetical protein [Escherichia coli O157]EKH6093863.1 hypothetical protein [Escherichia coli O157]